MLLEKILTEKDGYWKYKTGWTDQRVVDEVCPRLIATNVAYIRINSFGPSKSWTKKEPVDQKEDRLETIERELTKLRAICSKIVFEFGIKID